MFLIIDQPPPFDVSVMPRCAVYRVVVSSASGLTEKADEERRSSDPMTKRDFGHRWGDDGKEESSTRTTAAFFLFPLHSLYLACFFHSLHLGSLHHSDWVD